MQDEEDGENTYCDFLDIMNKYRERWKNWKLLLVKMAEGLC